jgi:hypothetical protein
MGLPANNGVHVDSVSKIKLLFLAHVGHIVVFVPENKNTILAPKRHFVNNLRPVTEVSREFLNVIRILQPYFEPLY